MSQLPSPVWTVANVSLQLSVARPAQRQLCSFFCSKNKMSPIVQYLCISSWKQVHLFFPALAMIHARMQGLEKKAFCKFYWFRQTCSLQRTKGSSLCIKTLWKELLNKFLSLTRTRHRPVLALFWEQFASLLALKSRVSLGTDVCMCPLSLTCSSTHLAQKFPACWKTSAVPMSLTSDPHFPICLAAILSYPFSPTHGKNTQFPCFAVEVQSPSYKSTANRDHTRQGRAADVRTPLTVDLDPSPSMEQKRQTKIKQVLFWPPQWYLTCLFAATVCVCCSNCF